MSNVTKKAVADDLWTKLTNKQRREAGLWIDIIQRMESSDDKSAELAAIMTEYEGLKGLSRSGVYRKMAAFDERGIAGIIHANALHRLDDSGTALPDAFVSWWQSLCGLHQRRKAAAVWRTLFYDHLIPGKVIPGYNTDWRGIWALDHPYQMIPVSCPYAPGGQVPRGWSYRNLVALAPSPDVWAGAAIGAKAMRSMLPSIPHTRVGLALGSLFLIDDVQHDLKVVFRPGQMAERPLELGMMEALTGRYVTWGVVPTQRREDGTRIMLRESYMRYILADLLCRVGVNRNGCTIIAEHGTAAIRGGLIDQINKEIHRLTGISEFLRVETSSCYGAPLIAGLYKERGSGNPRFKAMLESSWNLLHNELAMLPGQVGKDRDNSPSDIEGRDQETRMLAQIAQEIARIYPDETRHFLTGYMTYHEFCQMLCKAKSLIENRTTHSLEGWEECGFLRQIATVAGVEVDLDQQAHDNPDTFEQLLNLVKVTKSPISFRRMSPLQAWRKADAPGVLTRFPISLAAIILDACGRTVRVSDKGTIELKDEFTNTGYTWNAIARAGSGITLPLQRRKEYRCVLNPFQARTVLISDMDGRFIGTNSQPYEAVTLGDREADKRNLSLLAQASAEQRKRLNITMAGQVARRREEVARATSDLLSLDKHDRLSTAKPATLDEVTGSVDPDQIQGTGSAFDTADFLASITE